MTTDPAPATNSQLDDLLTRLVDQVAQVRCAVVVSEDGLVVSKSTSFPRPEAERLAATASALMSLNRGVCTDFGGGAVLQSLLEMSSGYLVLTSAGTGAYLAVITTENADVGVVVFEMNMLVKKIGEHLSALPRAEFAFGSPSSPRTAWQSSTGGTP
ncbi:roadblock/LC7 domain-containing protein [Streptomyces phyllanthi]|uniref:Roadblock/LC7 domain-containing protein n=1 Tax=Streptomyces phyllanthi TaxID=1803180 RepID=A0A5N8W715_9ACTN|nr:roadblock/LC7 domain-containing protein [Streptomyces phyllanthi]MPY41915.1 roadblock/LC7 domain-containing protein [Streptomyces phyllanthi]